MEVKTRKGNLIITMPMEEARLSASGKTRVVASSRGVRKTTIRVDGEIVSVVANAFIPADGHVGPGERRRSGVRASAISQRGRKTNTR